MTEEQILVLLQYSEYFISRGLISTGKSPKKTKDLVTQNNDERKEEIENTEAAIYRVFRSESYIGLHKCYMKSGKYCNIEDLSAFWLPPSATEEDLWTYICEKLSDAEKHGVIGRIDDVDDGCNDLFTW